MKTFAFVLLLSLVAPISGAAARACDWDDHHHMNLSCGDGPSRFGPRHDVRDARIAVTTQDGDATLLLTDEVVAVQLSDRKLHDIRRELRAKEDEEEDDNPLATAIKTVVFTSVRSVLAHSAECPLRDLRSVEYRDGRLVFLTRDDGHVFADMSVDDHDVMEGLSQRDAQEFVREFRRVKAAQRQ
jgi:hypothetical protein